MPDLMNFSVTRDGLDKNGSPKFSIKCAVIGTRNGSNIGVIDTNYPEILNQFTDEELNILMKDIANIFINKIIDIQLDKSLDKNIIKNFEVYSEEKLLELGRELPITDIKLSEI